MISRNLAGNPFMLLALIGGTASCDHTTTHNAANFGQARAVGRESRNEHPSFYIRVDVDHPNRIYQVGKKCGSTSNRSEGLYLIYLMPNGTTPAFFPTAFNTTIASALTSGCRHSASKCAFRLRISEPTGQETLKAIVTRKPLKNSS